MKKLTFKADAPQKIAFGHGSQHYEFDRADEPFIVEDSVALAIRAEKFFVVEDAETEVEDQSDEQSAVDAVTEESETFELAFDEEE